MLCIMFGLRTFWISLIILNVYAPLVLADQLLTWKDCLREAAKNHPDLIAAQEQVIQQQASKTITASNHYPQVSANASASSTDSKSSSSSNNFSYGASASQLLFDGLKTINDVNAASANIKASQENFKFTSATVRFRLRQAFINLLKAQELLNLTDEIYKIRQSNVDLITLRYQSGTEHKGALLTAQANLSQATFEINQAKRGLETAQRQLTKELGRREFSPVTVKESFEVSDTATQKPDFEALSKNNPSLLKIEAQKNAAAFNIKSNQGEFWPEISLNGDISKSDDRWPPHGQETSGGVHVSLPLFEGGRLVANVSQAKSAYRQIEQQERSTHDGIVLSLQQQWGGLQDSIEKVKVQQSFLDAVTERAKIAEQQYSVGLISFDDWTIIEDDLVSNKKFFLDAQANALLAEASWVQAKGETLEYEN